MLPLPAAGAGATGDTTMSSTQHQLIEQCATRLRGIVEALDNIHDNTPLRWSTDLDDVHSSAESLLALIKDQAPTQAAQGLAGAALAQPSPASVCATPAGENCPGDGVKSCKKCPEQPEAERLRKAYEWGYGDGQNNPNGYSDKKERDACVNELLKQPSPAHAEQEEAERPEVVAWSAERYVAGDHYSKPRLSFEQPYSTDRNVEALMTVAQHDRIVGALRAERDGAIKLLGQSVWQKIQLLTQERDAALARVAEFEAQAQHSVPDGAADLCRFLAKLYCELDGLRYSTAKLPAEQIADALIFKWPVLQGARNQLNIKRISEQPYDESKLHSAIAAMLAAAPGKEVPQAWIDVQEERRRQITAEGWTPEHDDEHADGQMAQAAGCYALHAGGIGTDWPDGRQNGAALFWPWDKDSWKPTTPRRDLVKACALALAEIERLDRAAATQGGPSDA